MKINKILNKKIIKLEVIIKKIKFNKERRV